MGKNATLFLKERYSEVVGEDIHRPWLFTTLFTDLMSVIVQEQKCVIQAVLLKQYHANYVTFKRMFRP